MSKKRQSPAEQNGKWKLLLTFFLLTAAGIVFSILCLSNSRLSFVARYRALWLVVSTTLLSLLCAASICLAFFSKSVWVKSMISIYLFLLFCLVLIFILQKTGFFRLIETSEGLQQYLEKSGVWMPILYISLQYLQVILLPIPSIVSTVAGVALFGAFKTMVFSLIGILLGSITAFYIGRKLGYKAVAWIVGEDALHKWRKKLNGKDNLILTIMFVLPLFPDDVLCFVAGLSSMGNRYFLTMILFARLIGIAGTCYSFDLIPWTTWWGLTLWGIILAIVVLSFFLIYKYMDEIQTIFKRMNKRKNSKK